MPISNAPSKAIHTQKGKKQTRKITPKNISEQPAIFRAEQFRQNICLPRFATSIPKL